MRRHMKHRINRQISLLILIMIFVRSIPANPSYAYAENEISPDLSLISISDKGECPENADNSIIDTSDGGFALIGNSKHPDIWSSYIHFVKTGKDGNLQWEKRLDLGEGGFAHHEKKAFSLKETEDGYVIAGAINIDNQSDALIVKTDFQGSVQWIKRFGLPQCECLYDIEIVPDGIIAAGNKQLDNEYHTFIVKLSIDGALLWEYTGDCPGGRLKDLMVLEDGSLAAIGYSESCVSLIRLTEDGYEIYSEPGPREPDCRLEASLGEGSISGYTAASAYKDVNLSITVDIPEFKRTVDTGGNVLYGIPNLSAYTKKSFTPLLPVITRIYILPEGSVVNRVELTDQVTELREEPAGLKMLIPENETCRPLEGSFTLDNPYPQEMFKWKQYYCDDRVYLYLSIIPVQYDYEEGQMTLFKSLNFNVSLSIPDSPVKITDVIVNNVGTAIDRMGNVTANALIVSETSRTVNMGWIFRDVSGTVISAGNKEANLIRGENSVSFTFDAADWTSGSKELTITLRDTGVNSPIMASYFESVEVSGLNIYIEADKRLFTREDTITFQAEVRDERGFPVTGLSENEFGLKTMDSSVHSFSVSESVEGLYDIVITASLLEEKIHHLSITCTDGAKYGKTVLLFEVKASE